MQPGASKDGLRASLKEAVKEARRAAHTLYDPRYPLNNNLWTIAETTYENDLSFIGKWTPVRRSRQPEVYDVLKRYVDNLTPQGVEHFTETDWFSNYYKSRNLYVPHALYEQGNVSKWFLGGSPVPRNFRSNLAEFWEKYVPGNYRVLNEMEISCPKYDASAGVVLIRDDDGLRWHYGKKGPVWDQIQAAQAEWEDMVIDVFPRKLLAKPIEHLIGARVKALEMLALEIPGIRLESGVSKARLIKMVMGNLYILGRKFISMIQDGPWSNSIEYIGKASNTRAAALQAAVGKLDEYFGVHGDDWVYYNPSTGEWNMSDWSWFDIFNTARQILASYSAQYDATKHVLTKREKVLFYALAYLAIRTPMLWLWKEHGKRHMSIRPTLGWVRSGSGDFVLHNNARNHSALRVLLEGVSNEGVNWKEFVTQSAVRFGWQTKLSASFSSQEGFVAARSFFLADEYYRPRPSIASVTRNWMNPAYNPEEYPHNTTMFMTTRFRDSQRTLALTSHGEFMADELALSAYRAGVRDPWGENITDATLSRVIAEAVGEYSASSYLLS